jgi:hypothetical protein
MSDESKAAATAPPWIHRLSTAPLLEGRTARDSMVSEGPLATDASFARQAFDNDMSEDMLGAHSVSLMVSTPSVTHKKNWLQKQVSCAKKAILRGRSKRASVISSAEGAGELPQHHL